MNFVIRTDASEEIGIGHFVRCLSLAEALVAKKHSVTMLCHSLPNSYKQLINEKGIKVLYLPNSKNEIEDAQNTIKLLHQLAQPISWLIVDSYELGLNWQKLTKVHVDKLMVIDDFANSKIECDLVLSQNYPPLDYSGLISENTILCRGLEYVLLRPEFHNQRCNLKKAEGDIKRVLVSFGGSDHTHSTLNCLEILIDMNLTDIHIDLVVGDLNPDKKLIQYLCNSQKNFSYHQQTKQMAELMAKADLALGSGGSTHWERCFLGLPAIVNVVAENQIRTTEALEREGMVINIGSNNDREFYFSLSHCLNNPQKVREMSKKCLQLIPYNPQCPLRVINYLC